MDNTVTITVDENAIIAKIESLLDETTMTQIQRTFATTLHPYVPYDTGRLSTDITVDSTGVTYHAPYAAKNYYGTDIAHKREKHPLATALWDKVAMQTEQEALAHKVELILKQKAREQNG